MCQELLSINQNEVRNRIQESVTLFFDTCRNKIDELEQLTVSKVENSKNLNELVGILDETHSHMEENNVAERYDSERAKLEVKVSDVRYTFVCQRKQHYDQIIQEIENDNKNLSIAVEKAKKMIVEIYECDRNEEKIDKTLKDLVSGLITIDKKRPDFSDIKGSERHYKKMQIIEQVSGQPDDTTGIIKREINFNPIERNEANWKAEEMIDNFYNRENTLCRREMLDGEKFVETEVMKLKLHLQKIVAVPTTKTTRVFLMGGSKDSEGKQAINN